MFAFWCVSGNFLQGFCGDVSTSFNSVRHLQLKCLFCCTVCPDSVALCAQICSVCAQIFSCTVCARIFSATLCVPRYFFAVCAQIFSVCAQMSSCTVCARIFSATLCAQIFSCSVPRYAQCVRHSVRPDIFCNIVLRMMPLSSAECCPMSRGWDCGQGLPIWPENTC